MKIRIGEIVNVKHSNDQNHSNIHPFLIINISKKNIYAVQCTSVKINDDESYFSRKNIKSYQFIFSDLKYSTHIRLDLFEKIESEQIKRSIVMAKKKEFITIYKKLMNSNWENTRYFNKNAIINHIEKGQENYGQVWEI